MRRWEVSLLLGAIGLLVATGCGGRGVAETDQLALGDGQYPITTASPQAQQLFDRALTLYFSGHRGQAARTFEAAAAAVRDPRHHKYSPAAGLPELRAAVAARMIEGGVPTEAGDVLITNGGKQAVSSAFATLMGPGDEVLLPAPYWVSYPEAINLAGATPVIVSAGIDAGDATPRPVSGGDISSAWRLDAPGQSIFIKTGPASSYEMFAAEAEGLSELAQANAVRVPAVRAVGEHSGSAFVAFEWLQLDNASSACERLLGQQLAALHRTTGHASAGTVITRSG